MCGWRRLQGYGTFNQRSAEDDSPNAVDHGLDPFKEISEEYKHPLQEEHKSQLTSFLTKSSAGAFLLEIHEFLLLVLKKPKDTDTFRPDWGLKETVEGYMERKGLDVPPEVDQFFPEDILLSQCIEMWKFSALLRHGRNQN
ncbi:E3 ubiquitin-protein ligase rnf213-alpha [Garra rufa]|uniref:E3 ubiquitin-protein ligase rnf213-alpha n=1 Tax=Garra rufa TaxID=137080 RepID=UPI003CCEA0BD